MQRDTDYLGGFNSWFYDCPVCAEQPDLPRDMWLNIGRLKRAEQTLPESL